MNIAEDQLAKLRNFGYTEVEARFLYLVATHSGYFTVRQFLDFAKAKSGKRNARLVEKLFGLGHASAQQYTRRSRVYHLCSRQLYSAIGKDHLRNRREHELVHIKTRLLALDFILAHPKEDYFETADAKRRYFVERFKVSENLFTPSDGRTKGITFADRFPLCVAYPSPDYMPVVTFTYVDPDNRNLDAYIGRAVERGKDSDFKTLGKRQGWRDQNGGVGRIRSAASDSGCPSARMAWTKPLCEGRGLRVPFLESARPCSPLRVCFRRRSSATGGKEGRSAYRGRPTVRAPLPESGPQC